MEKKTYRSSTADSTISVQGGGLTLLKKIFELLEHRGFTIQTDQRILKQYPSLADTHWEGAKGDLLFKAKIYPAGFRIEFYQEVNTKNPSGGNYDFDKFGMMPYLIRCEFLVNRKYIYRLLENNGFVNTADPVFKNALEDVMYKIKSCWHYEEGKELPSYKVKYGNGEDRDKKQIYNGQIKYFRDHKGRLKRGRVFYNLNNAWWVVLNERDFTNVSSWSLFDLTTAEDRIPKIYSRAIPHRIRAEKARGRFNAEFSYSILRENHIDQLRLLISKELASHDKEMAMSLKKPLKKDTVILKTKGLKHAVITVEGSYFSDREGITFSETGFIGFAGWASGYNLKPFVDAFEKWMDWLENNLNQAA